MEDECDFEELAAMLSDDEEDIADKSTTKTAPNAAEEESSDDDIGDDELDKLAALIAEDAMMQEEKPESVPVQVKQESDVQLLSPPDNPVLTDSVHMSDPVVNEDSEEEEDDDEVQSQLELIKLQMQMLEAKLKKKKKSPKVTELKQETEVVTVKKPSPAASKPTVNASASVKSPKSKLFSSAARPETHKSPSIGKNKMQMNDQKRAAAPPVVKKDKSPPDHTMKEVREDLFFSEQVKVTAAHKASGSLKTLTSKGTPETKAKPAAKSFYKKKEKAGDSDSDWDDLDGEKTSNLTNAGKELNTLIKQGPQERKAHTANFDGSDLEKFRKTPPTNNWKKKTFASSTPPSGKNLSTPPTSGKNNSTVLTGGKKPSSGTQYGQQGAPSQDFEGIRVIKPLVSRSQFCQMKEGRKLFRLSTLYSKVNTSDLENDWFTLGILVQKTEPKLSAKGKHFSIMKLNDLDNCDRLVTLFLFQESHKEHWKLTVGTVIGLLNPTVMKNQDKAKNPEELAITIDNPKMLLKVGQSKDLGFCKSKTKAGRNCTNHIDMQKGEFCTYHVQSAYKKHSSKRAELQAGFTGVQPRSFEKKLYDKGSSSFCYGGQSFSASTAVAPRAAGASKNKASNLTLQGLQYHVTRGSTGLKNTTTTLSIHDLLPDDKAAMAKIASEKKVKEADNEIMHDLLSMPTSGSMHLVRHLASKDHVVKEKSTGASARATMSSISAKEMLKMVKKPVIKKPKASELLMAQDDIVFDFDQPLMKSPLAPLTSNVDKAKQKAIARLRVQGGAEKLDPNAVKHAATAGNVERVKKRLAEASEGSSADSADGETKQPPKKKSRILGNLDLDDPEVQKLLNAKSSHAGLVTQEEQEALEAYFDVREKKEQLEEKMESVKEVSCKVYQCKKCKYIAMSALASCRSENHPISTFEGKKRFFRCKNCKRYCSSIKRLPDACSNCGSGNYERTSMHRERKGPVLPTEQLLLRGVEEKFLGSLQS